jgi:glycosyltransferase involved in cell wall biosynthesis
MRILFVTCGLPWPPDIGPRVRDYNLIRHTAESCSVLVLSLATEGGCPETARLGELCELVEAFPQRRRSFREHAAGLARGALAGRPLATHPFFYAEFAARIREVVASRRVDVVQIEHSFLAPYVLAVPKEAGCRTVLSLHNIGARQYGRMVGMKVGPVRRAGHLVKWLAMLRWEPRWARRFDHTVVVSQEEKRLLQRGDPTLPVTVVENGVDTRACRPLEPAGDDGGMIFVGTLGYPPNSAAAVYFCEKILPRIRREVPHAHLTVVGGNPPARLRRLAGEGFLTVTGRVPDVTPHYRDSAVSVVPLRAGGGTRLKILEAMALGRPVVSTSLGCEGLDVTDGRHLLIADSPEEFAAKVGLLLKSPRRRQDLAEEARLLVEKTYDWAVIGRKLVGLYGDLAARRPRCSPAPANP